MIQFGRKLKTTIPRQYVFQRQSRYSWAISLYLVNICHENPWTCAILWFMRQKTVVITDSEFFHTQELSQSCFSLLRYIYQDSHTLPIPHEWFHLHNYSSGSLRYTSWSHSNCQQVVHNIRGAILNHETNFLFSDKSTALGPSCTQTVVANLAQHYCY